MEIEQALNRIHLKNINWVHSSAEEEGCFWLPVPPAFDFGCDQTGCFATGLITTKI